MKNLRLACLGRKQCKWHMLSGNILKESVPTLLPGTVDKKRVFFYWNSLGNSHIVRKGGGSARLVDWSLYYFWWINVKLDECFGQRIARKTRITEAFLIYFSWPVDATRVYWCQSKHICLPKTAWIVFLGCLLIFFCRSGCDAHPLVAVFYFRDWNIPLQIFWPQLKRMYWTETRKSFSSGTLKEVEWRARGRGGEASLRGHSKTAVTYVTCLVGGI